MIDLAKIVTSDDTAKTNFVRRSSWAVAYTKEHGRLPSSESHMIIRCRYCQKPEWFPVSMVSEGKVNSVFHCCNKPDCIREDKRQEGSHPHDELDNILHLKEIYDAIPLDQESW